jgi:Domain of unknown function DUF11
MTALLIGLVASPGSAQAAPDLAISQTQSASVVSKGAQVTFDAVIRNVGTETYPAVFAEMSSLGGHGSGADDPYVSASTTQGVCTIKSGSAYGYVYHFVVCELGSLAPGASVHITATVQANQSANYFANLLPNAYEGGYQDNDNSNNAASGRVTVSIPPTITGSKKIKLTGLPAGCATGDFTFRATAKVAGVKKMKASIFFPGPEGGSWAKTATGATLKGTIPVSRLSDELGLFYKLKIKAKRGGGKHLTKVVEFQPC